MNKFAIILLPIALHGGSPDTTTTNLLINIQIIEQVMDAALTTYALSKGAVELNPLLEPLGIYGFLAVKVGTIYLMLELKHSIKTAEDIKLLNKVFIGLNLLYVYILCHNLKELIRS